MHSRACEMKISLLFTEGKGAARQRTTTFNAYRSGRSSKKSNPSLANSLVMAHARSVNSSSLRPKSSLSEHVAKEIQRDYPTGRRPASRRGPIRAGARRIKTFVIATAGGLKRVTVATGRESVRVGGQLKRSVNTFTRTLSNSTAPQKNRTATI